MRSKPGRTEAEPVEETGVGIDFLRKPAVLGLAIAAAMMLSYRCARAPRPSPQPGAHHAATGALPDLPSTDGGPSGGSGGRSNAASVLGRQGDAILAKARVMNVFRMQRSLVAVTEAAVFIHATLADELPEWIQRGKTVQIEGRIVAVKTRTNIHVEASRITAMH